MIQRLLPLILIAGLVLDGCAPAVPLATATPQFSTNIPGDTLQSPVYPGLEWTMADNSEGMGW
jgi:hypothetical protein